MKLTRLAIVSVACVMLSETVRAQSPDIISFQGDGQLTWTNSNTNLFYQVQWAASLLGTNDWQPTYSTLLDIQSTGTTVTVPVPMFYRISGSSNRMSFAAVVPKTGQTTSYGAGDDGDSAKGESWPTPRFTVGTGSAANCVVDNLTGLMWQKNPDMTKRVWSDALAYCTGLDGTDARGGYDDWRLPNLRELQSLIDYGHSHIALPSGHPFVGVAGSDFWTSTTFAFDTNLAFCVATDEGWVSAYNDKATYTAYVWPVRGDQ